MKNTVKVNFTIPKKMLLFLNDILFGSFTRVREGRLGKLREGIKKNKNIIYGRNGRSV
jgi:hypothetical protein